MARTKKEKAHFLNLQRQMLVLRSYYLYSPEARIEKKTWRRERPISDLEDRRINTTEKADKTRHIAASLQHDLWS